MEDNESAETLLRKFDDADDWEKIRLVREDIFEFANQPKGVEFLCSILKWSTRREVDDLILRRYW